MTSFPNQSKVAPERLEFHLEGGFPAVWLLGSRFHRPLRPDGGIFPVVL